MAHLAVRIRQCSSRKQAVEQRRVSLLLQLQRAREVRASTLRCVRLSERVDERVRKALDGVATICRRRQAVRVLQRGRKARHALACTSAALSQLHHPFPVRSARQHTRSGV